MRLTEHGWGWLMKAGAGWTLLRLAEHDWGWLSMGQAKADWTVLDWVTRVEAD